MPPAKPRPTVKPPRENKKALRALNAAIWHDRQAKSWGIIYRESLGGGVLEARAQQKMLSHATQAYDNFMIVRVALGYDPEADEPSPSRHWDAGA